MGYWMRLDAKSNVFDDISFALEQYAETLDNYSDIEDIVHTVDFLESEVEGMGEYDCILDDELDRVKN